MFIEKVVRFLKKIFKILGSLLFVIILIVAGYASYITLQYYRIEDQQIQTIHHNSQTQVQLNQEYKIMTYNVGFGAYSHDFSFFMDGGKDSVAKNKAEVLKNTNGAIATLQTQNPDFIFLQEVDTNSTRSYHVNQDALFAQAFADYGHIHSINFHSGFLFYPLLNPHGSVLSGLTTLSKYAISTSIRRSLPVSNVWPTKFFDLDRALQIHRLPIMNSTQELVLIHAHLSAYDKGGLIRKQQLVLLNAILEQEKQLGNYVIVGGDYNHDLIGDLGEPFTNQPVPSWVQIFPEESLVEGFQVVKIQNAPSVRSTDVPYDEKGIGKDKKNYFCIVDGFIVSDNIEVNLEASFVVENEFLYSDHQPVCMSFTIK